MKKIQVIWASFEPGVPARGYWDMGILESLFANDLYRPVQPFQFEHIESFELLTADVEGAIVVLKANPHHPHVGRVNEALARLKWVVLIYAGDEEGMYPWDEIQHPNMKRWIIAPKVGVHEHAGFLMGEGWPPAAPLMAQQYEEEAHNRRNNWFFSGQITHNRREGMVRELFNLPDGKLIQTEGFAQGLPYNEYMREMSAAKIVPCPSGIHTQDSFRFYEALESGCIPIADDVSPDSEFREGYWQMVFPGAPFPIIKQLKTLPEVIQKLVADWPANGNRVFSWWQQYKRALAYKLYKDIVDLTAVRPEPNGLGDKLTVLIPTSPIPSHPSTEVIEQTIASVRERLPECEIIIMADGVRDEQRGRKQDYDQYLRRLLWLSNNRYKNVLPIIFEEHQHQANITREALKHVRTPNVLFVEHDCPLVGEIDFARISDVVEEGMFNMIRLHYAESIHPEHLRLMLHGEARESFAPIIATAQWSQRPHIASKEWYTQIIDRYFSTDSRTMIEDVMHSVVANAFEVQGLEGWKQFKLGIYAPEGDIKRSTTIDGRQDDEKYPMKFAYPGEVPEYAPQPY